MSLFGYTMNLHLSVFLLSLGLLSSVSLGQQIVQRGAFGSPAQVMDETQRWSTPLRVASDHEVDIYIPDVTSSEWLKRNYSPFEDKGQYVLSFFTFYKTPIACRINQTGWGYADREHLDACNDIGYRLRQVLIDTHLKSATLIMAAMVDQSGEIVPGSIERRSISRTWGEIDANTQEALKTATALISQQMRIYDRKIQNAQ